MSSLEYRRKESKRRNFIAYCASAALYFLAALVIVILGLLSPRLYSERPGPVHVRLGNPQGLINAPDPVPQLKPPEPEPEPLAPSPKRESPAPKPSPTPKPTEKPAVPVKPAPAVPPQAEAAAEPSVVSPAPALPQKIRGIEKGNVQELEFIGGGGEAGRNMYAFIYLYMPLPSFVSNSVYEVIRAIPGIKSAELRKERFKFFYQWDTAKGGWKLQDSAQVPISLRPELWTILEDARYDLVRAEYKMRNPGPKPVVLLFSVSPDGGPSSPPRMVDLVMLGSSGYTDIDEAVLFGFKQASFRNASKTTVKAQFTYSFEGRN